MSSVEQLRRMGRLRRWHYRRQLVRWLEKNPPTGWLSRDVDRLFIEGRLKWLDEGCPERKVV